MTEGARGEIIWTPPDDAAATSRIGQFTRWLRKMPVDIDLSVNLLASELTAV